MDLPAHKHAFHELEVRGGVLADECAVPLRGFFRSLRREGVAADIGSPVHGGGGSGGGDKTVVDVIDGVMGDKATPRLEYGLEMVPPLVKGSMEIEKTCAAVGVL